jgi:DNA-binding response OmpR family regulator/pSer/pThr/pTyr-binding forkhead associated (FHA) protein
MVDVILGAAHMFLPEYEWGQSRKSYFKLDNQLTFASSLTAMKLAAARFCVCSHLIKRTLSSAPPSQGRRSIRFARKLLFALDHSNDGYKRRPTEAQPPIHSISQQVLALDYRRRKTIVRQRYSIMINQRLIVVDESEGVPENPGRIIRKFPFRIGRRSERGETLGHDVLAQENDIVLHDLCRPFELSRSHLEIGFWNARPYVRDLGSVKGSIVNDQAVGGRRDGGTVFLEQADSTVILGSDNSPWRFRIVQPQDRRHFRMVIAEDDRVTRRILTDMFDADYDILTAENGVQALQLCVREAPDIAILDWQMPELEGVDVCRMLKSNLATANLPVIMLTSRDQADDTVSGIQAGADDYITKPINPRELKARIAGVLTRSRRARNLDWLTALPSEAAFYDEVDAALAGAGSTMFGFVIVTVHGLGQLQEQGGRQGVETFIRELAEHVWRESLRHGQTVVGQLRLGRWTVLTPKSELRALKKELSDAMTAATIGIPVTATVENIAAQHAKNCLQLVENAGL